MESIMSKSAISTLAAIGAVLFVAAPASAQQMGRDSYAFPPRSPSAATQLELQQQIVNNGAANGSSSAGGLGALTQYLTQYSSSSTSIANMNQIIQTVTGGSTASVGQSTDQTSAGNQDSVAKTKATIDNSLVMTNSNNQPPK